MATSDREQDQASTAHPAESASAEESSPSPAFVTQLTPNDVLFGRGAPSIGNEGNVRFRQLVQSRKREYISTGKRQVKDWIARQLIAAVSARKGRFLRKVESLVETETMGVPEGVLAWVAVKEENVLQKVKQALRDRDVPDDEPRSPVRIISAAAAAPAPASNPLQQSLELDIYVARLQRMSELQHQQQHQQHQQSLFEQSRASLLEQQPPPPSIGDYLRSRAQQQDDLSRLQGRAFRGDQTQAMLDAFQSMNSYSTSMARSSFTSPLSEAALLGVQGSAGIRSGLLGASNTLPYQASASYQALPAGLLASLGLGSNSSARNPPALSQSVFAPALSSPSSGQDRISPAAEPVGDVLLQGAISLTEETAGDIAIRVAFELAKKPLSEVDATGHLRLSLMEMHFLSVLCSHGLPVWDASVGGRDTRDAPDTFVFTWSRFGTLLAQVAHDWCERRTIFPVGKLSVNQAEEEESRNDRRAVVMAAMYATDLAGLAKQTVTLMEKVRVFSGSSKIGLGLWFERELCRWGASLDVAAETGAPVAVTVSDLASRYPQSRQDVCIKSVCLLGGQSCRDIVAQVAALSRLRSIFRKDQGKGIESKVEAAIKRSAATGKVWKGRPSWWGTGGNSPTHDVLLLQGLLSGGFLGVIDELSGIIPGDSSGRELGLSKASIEEHMEGLVVHLHEEQEAKDFQAIINGLVGQHLPHLSGASAVSQPQGVARQVGESKVDPESVSRKAGGDPLQEDIDRVNKRLRET